MPNDHVSRLKQNRIARRSRYRKAMAAINDAFCERPSVLELPSTKCVKQKLRKVKEKA
jgi:hypothetical protein